MGGIIDALRLPEILFQVFPTGRNGICRSEVAGVLGDRWFSVALRPEIYDATRKSVVRIGDNESWTKFLRLSFRCTKLNRGRSIFAGSLRPLRMR